MAEEAAEETNSLEQLKRSMQYALIKNCDMNEEMRSDAVDLVISAVEKYQTNYEMAARMVKDQVSAHLMQHWNTAAAYSMRHVTEQISSPCVLRRWTRSTTRPGLWQSGRASLSR